MSNPPNESAKRAVKLSPEQEEAVTEGLQDLEAGAPLLSFDEVLERCRKKVREWHPDQSA